MRLRSPLKNFDGGTRAQSQAARIVEL